MDNKKTFEVKLNDKDTKFAVKRPDNKTRQAGQQYYNKAFRNAIESGAIVRARIEQVMRDQNLWDDIRQKEYQETTKRLLGNELKLSKGGIKMNEARELALQMRADRWKLREMNYDRNQLDLHTAEAQAENDRFNFFVSACTLYADTGKPYYKDTEDYLNREDDPVGPTAAANLSKMLYGLDDKFEHKLPENRFLLKYKFVDDDLRLVDKQGNWVDAEGRRINKEGRLINDQGQLVDVDGNLLTEDGEYKVEFTPFLDDEGNPVTDENATPTPLPADTSDPAQTA